MLQRTIAEKVSCTGVGLHCGEPVQLTLHPARADTGHRVRAHRSSASRSRSRRARARSCSTALATTLGRGDATVGTVEHLLAALYGLGIDNIRIEVDGPELPVMDGSAAPFVFLIRSAGIFQQREERQVLRIRRKIEVVDGDRSIRIEPVARVPRQLCGRLRPPRDRPPGDRPRPARRRSASSARSRRRARSASCARCRRSGTPASRAAARSTTRSCSTTRGS